MICEVCKDWGETAQPDDMSYISCNKCHRKVVSIDYGIIKPAPISQEAKPLVGEVVEKNNWNGVLPEQSGEQTPFEKAQLEADAAYQRKWDLYDQLLKEFLARHKPADAIDYPEPDHIREPGHVT